MIRFAKSILDFRINRRKLHPAENIVYITIAAVICGAKDWNEIEDFGNIKKSFFEKRLDLSNGIPSHDTINRFFSLLNPDLLENKFREWIQTICHKCKNVLAIDGKTLRGAKEQGKKSIFHMVSAFCCSNGLSLAQVKTHEKSNEITAIPELIQALDLNECIITIDAMGCQTNIASKIIDAKADYLLAVKENQKELHSNIIDSFKYSDNRVIISCSDVDYGHGRIETRTTKVCADLSMIESVSKRKNIKTIVCLETERYISVTGITEKATRYYISSLKADPVIIGNSIRAHWGIENKLHWVLDVIFKEDLSRKRKKNAVMNFSLLLKIALSKIKSNEKKASIKRKIKMAGWSDDLLAEILDQVF